MTIKEKLVELHGKRERLATHLTKIKGQIELLEELSPAKAPRKPKRVARTSRVSLPPGITVRGTVMNIIREAGSHITCKEIEARIPSAISSKSISPTLTKLVQDGLVHRINLSVELGIPRAKYAYSMS